MLIFLIPLLVSPKETVPSISVTTAGSAGFRDSNSSVTRGKPPVISRVLPIALGILTRVCPLLTLSPCLTVKLAVTGRIVPPAKIEPSLSTISTWGLKFLSLDSTITICFFPPSTAST